MQPKQVNVMLSSGQNFQLLFEGEELFSTATEKLKKAISRTDYQAEIELIDGFVVFGSASVVAFSVADLNLAAKFSARIGIYNEINHEEVQKAITEARDLRREKVGV